MDVLEQQLQIVRLVQMDITGTVRNVCSVTFHASIPVLVLETQDVLDFLFALMAIGIVEQVANHARSNVTTLVYHRERMLLVLEHLFARSETMTMEEHVIPAM